jgi:hypothetical protein
MKMRGRGIEAAVLDYRRERGKLVRPQPILISAADPPTICHLT